MRAATERRRQEHNDRMELAWFSAWLTAYAPEKSTKFPKLEKLLSKAPGRSPSKQSDWRKVLGSVTSWVEGRGS